MTLRAAEDGWPYPDALGDIVDVTCGPDDDLLAITADRHLFDDLDPIEREVIEAHFGLRGHALRTMKQLHAELGVPRADLRHALDTGLEKLRLHLSA